MPSTIEQVKRVLLEHRGKARKQDVARELKISLDYAGLILGELKRKREVVCSGGFYVLTSIKEDAAQDKEQKKPAILSKRADRRLNGLKRAKDIKKPRTVKRAPKPLGSILGIGEALALTLEKAGYNTIESLAKAPISRLMAETKLKLHIAAQLINQARKIK